jgi:hypothetical protein
VGAGRYREGSPRELNAEVTALLPFYLAVRKNGGRVIHGNVLAGEVSRTYELREARALGSDPRLIPANYQRQNGDSARENALKTANFKAYAMPLPESSHEGSSRIGFKKYNCFPNFAYPSKMANFLPKRVRLYDVSLS